MELLVDQALQSCHNLASLLIVVGVGDGDLLRRIVADPRISQKDILVLGMPGDCLPEGLQARNLKYTAVGDWNDVQQWVFEHFSDHKDIVRLAGCDILDRHPVGAQADSFRTAHLPRLHHLLGDRSWGLGNDINDTFMGFHHACLNARQLLGAPSIGQLAGTLGTIPAISIGAGPSVQEHLDVLRQLQDKCLLVACDAVYPALLANGVVPHIVTPLERLRQQAPLVAGAVGTRTWFCGLPVCHPDTVRPFADHTIYLHAFDKLYDWLAPKEQLRCLTGSSTGVLSFYVAASLTRGPVYLLGHDLAKSADGKTHFGGCDLADEGFAQETKNIGEFGVNGYETRMIPSNDGGLVESITWWDAFRAEISLQARLIPGRVFNVNAATKRYAVIENTLPGLLPDPTTLPDLPPLAFLAENSERLESFLANVHALPEDCDRFIASMSSLRADIAAQIRQSPHEWNLIKLMERMAPDAGVSPGNAAAFQYILRSALYNEQSYASYRARGFADGVQAQFMVMQNIDALADCLQNVVRQLKPVMQTMLMNPNWSPAVKEQARLAQENMPLIHILDVPRHD